MCSSFNSRKVIINNIPDIIDINKLITLLENLGVNIQKMDRVLILSGWWLKPRVFRNGSFKKEGGSLRGSIMIVGPL
jgi:UDP-N-acetylglucosamine 1-carboxyvinyltransferase